MDTDVFRFRSVFIRVHPWFQLGRPAVAEQAGDGDLKHGLIGAQRAMRGPFALFVPDHRAAGMAVEDPLGRVVGVGLGEAVRVFFGGDLTPVVGIERNAFKSGICWLY